MPEAQADPSDLEHSSSRENLLGLSTQRLMEPATADCDF